MAGMDPFVKTRYHKTKNIDFMESYIGHDFDFYLLPYATPMKTDVIPVERNRSRRANWRFTVAHGWKPRMERPVCWVNSWSTR